MINNNLVEIYCDGSCCPNPGRSGIGLAVYRDGWIDGLWYGIRRLQSTNNRAELEALHYSMRLAESELVKGSSVTIYSDSEYAINCITQWAFGWNKIGWKKTPAIKNMDIIKPAFDLFVRIKKHINVEHVRAHSGLEGNELADRLAVYAARSSEVGMSLFTGEDSVDRLLSMR
jgi:ribonuclease HI